MFNKLRNILIGVFASVIVIALGASACTASAIPEANPTATPEPVTANGGNGGQNPVAAAGQGQSQADNGNQGDNGYSNGGQVNPAANGSGTPQANIAGATTVHGVVNSLDLTGMSLTLDDGTSLYVQLGNSRYNQSIGFAPAAGEGVTVNGFIGDQALYSAITVTVDSTGQVYSFRDASGRPLWAGGQGNGSGGRP